MNNSTSPAIVLNRLASLGHAKYSEASAFSSSIDVNVSASSLVQLPGFLCKAKSVAVQKEICSRPTGKTCND